MNNVINKFFLWVVLLPAPLYHSMGVNELQLKAILRTKLIMDDRRPNSMQQMKRGKEKVSNRATLLTMFFSALLGCFFLIAFSVGKTYTVQLSIYFSMYIFLLASSLISDFTSVLIDIRDNYIILTKPVNDKTIVVARLLHIMIHICKLVLPMSLPGIVFMGINVGVAGTLLFFLYIMLATLLTIFLINALYIIILKITTPQKFQNIIATFQIVFAILLYGSYQVVPRLVNKMQLENYNFANLGKWVWIAPSYWFGRAWQTVMDSSYSTGGILSITLALFAPVISIYVVVKYFAPSFNQKLSLINSSSVEGGSAIPKAIITSQRRVGFISQISKWVCQAGAERMAFLLSWKMTSRSRDFKMKVYPSIGYMVVMVGLFLFQKDRFATFGSEADRIPILITGAIYFSSFVLIIALAQLTFSDKYKAAWIYYSTPVSSPGLLISGAFKAVVVKFYLPVVVLAFAAAMALIGPSMLPNLLLALFNELFICSIITYLTIRQLPFSTQQGNNSKTGSFIKGIITFIIPSVVAVLHFFVYKIFAVVCIFAIMSMILTWLVQGSIKKISWGVIKGE